METYSQEFKINLYRAKKIYSLLNNLSINKIQNMIKYLAELDREIKKGIVNEKIGFELFLIKFFH
ncbi:hypothetical protein [Mycoplasma sp. 1018B]|uniref:hypothetical protein n=1 Tax=Mycoplasma sp. 1018B TaxID=2967302 RepID=UPI0035931A4D